jgi:hypothetical protein
MNLQRELKRAGLSTELVRNAPELSDEDFDFIVEIEGVRFAIETRGRSPYPNELEALEVQRARLASVGVPVLLVPFASESTAAAMRLAGWSWADEVGNFDLRAPGVLLRQRTTNTAPSPLSLLLPQGSGSLGIVRSLIRFGGSDDVGASATQLAAQANVSQPRASQVLDRLLHSGLVSKAGRGQWHPDRAALLDRFVAEYRGPGGSEHYLYTLDSLTDTASRISSASRLASMAVSADVGPDLIAAWRRPAVLIIYVRDPSDLAGTEGLVEAQGLHDANVIVRSPKDASMFPVDRLVADVGGIQMPLADPTQMIWDLHQLGGQDRLEAAEVLRDWLLQNRH